MIECWFSEYGFSITGSIMQASYTVEPGDDLYATRWYVFGQMLDTLLAGGDIIDEVRIYNDSRIVEELNNELVPLNDYGVKSRRYYMMHDRPKMRTVSIHKTSTNRLRRELMQGEQTGS